MRLPIGLYRAGLGFVFSKRLVMVEHRGRTSGERRFVVLEVIARLDSVVRVASALGRNAQWYRNLAANEVAYLSTGTLRRVPATPRLLTEAESELCLKDYAARYPTAWRHLSAAVSYATDGDPQILIVEFTLRPRAA
ncbi:MAG: nitroreductase family deazaflavin-dependent oxidoreductase [Pseudolysinimonas sp.]